MNSGGAGAVELANADSISLHEGKVTEATSRLWSCDRSICFRLPRYVKDVTAAGSNRGGPAMASAPHV